MSFTWTPTVGGRYVIDCRAWNDGIAECRGNSDCVSGPPVYRCPGPFASYVINVVTPTPPTPLVVLNEPAPGISQSCNTVCNNSGRTCIDVGTNASATGGTYNTLSGFSCSYSQPANCNTTLTRQPQIAGGYVVCTGHYVDWTNCRCQ